MKAVTADKLLPPHHCTAQHSSILESQQATGNTLYTLQTKYFISSQILCVSGIPGTVSDLGFSDIVKTSVILATVVIWCKG